MCRMVPAERLRRPHAGDCTQYKGGTTTTGDTSNSVKRVRGVGFDRFDAEAIKPGRSARRTRGAHAPSSESVHFVTDPEHFDPACTKTVHSVLSR
jgi:hypothetical protein